MSKKANPYENFLNVLDSAAALDGIDQNDMQRSVIQSRS